MRIAGSRTGRAELSRVMKLAQNIKKQGSVGVACGLSSCWV